jgi:hypothetical protein
MSAVDRGRSTERHNSVSTQRNDVGMQVWGVGNFELVSQPTWPAAAVV